MCTLAASLCLPVHNAPSAHGVVWVMTAFGQTAFAKKSAFGQLFFVTAFGQSAFGPKWCFNGLTAFGQTSRICVLVFWPRLVKCVLAFGWVCSSVPWLLCVVFFGRVQHFCHPPLPGPPPPDRPCKPQTDQLHGLIPTLPTNRFARYCGQNRTFHHPNSTFHQSDFGFNFLTVSTVNDSYVKTNGELL